MFFKKEKKDDKDVKKDDFKKELIEELMIAKSKVEEKTFKNEIVELTNSYVDNFDISNIIEWVKEIMINKAKEGENYSYVALDGNEEFYKIGSDLDIENVSRLKERIRFKIIEDLRSYDFDVGTPHTFLSTTKEDYSIRIYWSE